MSLVFFSQGIFAKSKTKALLKCGGTDHGAANNVFIIGDNLNKKGFYNEMPNLSKLDKNGDIVHTIDFRRIYATILDSWLEVDDVKVLNKSFSKLNFI